MKPTSAAVFLCLVTVILCAGCASAPGDGETPSPTTVVTTEPTPEPVVSPVLVIDPRLADMRIGLDAVELSDRSGLFLTLTVDPAWAEVARAGAPVEALFFAYNTADRATGYVPASPADVRAGDMPYRTLSVTVYDATVIFKADLPRDSENKNLDIEKEYVYGAFVSLRD
ncbi:hypothetical protein [Methanofollis fontis]|uniref:Uncharacterized protein n=1 Tax=Methanofollis fontis TaxID=2052832 RepID=A0A483CNJ4_9EURY|nr:hypothetical protein [Methanofollis fontis]TAJ43572.1 hypothetical protein CUJ86_10610 [Methanofollis fontis]